MINEAFSTMASQRNYNGQQKQKMHEIYATPVSTTQREKKIISSILIPTKLKLFASTELRSIITKTAREMGTVRHMIIVT